MNVIKAGKVLSEITTTVFASAKTAQVAAESISPTAEKLPMPSATHVLAYHQKRCKRPQIRRKIPQKLSAREIYEMRKKELTDLANLREGYILNKWDIESFVWEEDAQYERIKEMIYIPSRKKSQLNIADLRKILKLTDEQYKMFSWLVSVNGRKGNQFSEYDLFEFVERATPEEFKKAKVLSFIKGRDEKQLSFWQIERLAKCGSEQFERLRKLLFIPSRKEKQLCYDDLIQAVRVNKQGFKNLLELLSHNPGNNPFSFAEIKPFLTDDKICKRLKELHYIEELGKEQLYFGYIKDYAKLPDNKYKFLKKLLHVDKFKDNQLSYSEIKKILRQKPEKIKKLISYLKDENLNIDSNIFMHMAEGKDTDAIVSLIKRCPHISPKDMLSFIEYSDGKIIDFIKPFFLNPKYEISKEFGWFKIKNKETNSCLSICANTSKNKEYFLEKPMPDGKREVIKIVKTQQGVYIDNCIATGNEEIFGLHGNYKQLHNFPKNYSSEDLLHFMENGDFKTSNIFECSPEKIGHANFSLPQGSNIYKKVNNSVISQLDTIQGRNSDRITIHYPNGRIATNDWILGLSTTLKPNGANNGMRIKKFLGTEKIDLSSSVEKDIITIRDNITGKKLQVPISTFLGGEYMDEIEISLYQKEEEIVKLLKSLSPTTILNLLKYKKTVPDVSFPFIKDSAEAYQKRSIVTLSKSPQTTSHEALHGITDILKLTEDAEIVGLHAKEAKKNRGFLSILSSYATNGTYFDAERGLQELISIMGTMNEYGAELSYRADATRLAFPETIKAIEKRLMKYYKSTIDELLK
ncbi:MAG: hypothetical protein K6A44_04830 [bacterium]|nr:hypothetical protein [bacterium]